MKIAIISSGQPRFCEETTEFIKKLKGYDQVDWFFYFWKDDSSQHLCGHYVVSPNWINVDVNWAMSKFKENLPENHNVILQLVDYNEIQRLDPIRQPVGVYKMFRGNYQSNLLRLEHEKVNGPYDLVIKTRVDLGLLSECNLKKCSEILSLQPNAIITVHDRQFLINGRYVINDWLAIGLPITMTEYCNAINHVHQYKVEFTAETLLQAHLEANRINVVQENVVQGDARYLGETINGKYYSKFGNWI